jgi:hypothetical protein
VIGGSPADFQGDLALDLLLARGPVVPLTIGKVVQQQLAHPEQQLGRRLPRILYMILS